jgi:hypothetical protein
MIISNFELLVKRILPLSPPGSSQDAAQNTVARRLVQAYFLTISNLELDRPVYFSVSYYVANINNNPLRGLIYNAGASVTRNFELVYDGNGVDNASANGGVTQTTSVLTALPFNRVFTITKSRNLMVAPGETAMLALFPNITPFEQTTQVVNILNPTITPSPQFEVHGFAKITQENNAESETNPYINQPAKVLINAEHRGTFLDNDFPLSTESTLASGTKIGMDFDQLSYSLPLAEGKSLYELPGA